MTAVKLAKGKTIDAITAKAVTAKIEITDNGTGKVIETFTTNSATGKFLISQNLKEQWESALQKLVCQINLLPC